MSLLLLSLIWLLLVTAPARAADTLTVTPSILSLLDPECRTLDIPRDSELAQFDALRARDGLKAYAGQSIGRVFVFNVAVFDLRNRKENNAATRLVNALHFPTREQVVLRQVLFAENDPIDLQQIAESERILRANSYLGDAVVLPLQQCDERIDLLIVVRDLWSFLPKLYLNRTGGFTSYGVLLEDSNFLGFGDALTLSFVKERERDSNGIRYLGKNLLASRLTLTAAYVSASDGETRQLELEQPFYSLDARQAFGVRLYANTQQESLEAQGQELARFDHEQTIAEVFAGVSPGLIDGYSQRYVFGITHSDDAFTDVGLNGSGTIPADRVLRYPWLRYSISENAFAVYRNLNDIHRTEDVSVGRFFSVLLGYADYSVGSDLQRWIFSVSYREVPLVSEHQLLKTQIDVSGARDRDTQELVSTLSTFRLNHHAIISRQQQFYSALLIEAGRNLADDELLVLGGDQGLRGYPAEYLLGDRRALVNLEYRYFFDAHYLNVFRFAGVVFFDAGKTESRYIQAVADSEWLRSTGVGLRMNSSKTNVSKMVHVDIAFPLDQQDQVGDVEIRMFGSSSF